MRGLQKVTIQQKAGQHTLALLDYKIVDKNDYLLPPENSPLEVAWGSGPIGVKSYYGYVNHYESTPSAVHSRTRMVCVGTSKWMNSVKPNTWMGTTRSAIARDILSSHRLRSVVHDHPYVLEQWATGTRSDLASLRALADESGYLLWVDGSTGYFLDPAKVFGNISVTTTPVIRRQDITNVQVMGGSNVPGLLEPSQRIAQYGLEYRTNELFLATGGDTNSPTTLSSSGANTFSEALDVTSAASRRQQDVHAIKLRFTGNARVRPGTLIRVQPGIVNNDQGGLWMVNQATHEINQKDFYTEVVGTRSDEVIPTTQVNTAGWNSTVDVPAVIRDGIQWEAQLQERIRG